MKKTSLKELKEDLSRWTEYAALGEKVYVSKYNKPYIILIPSQNDLVGVTGSGKSMSLRSILSKSPVSSKMLLAILEDDRGSSDE